MGKLIFTYTDNDFIENNREASKIELDVPDDMDINEYKIVCVRMASAIGYGNKSITKAFGDVFFMPSPTCLIIFKFIPSKSSLVIPGFLGTPAVIIITSEFFVSS